jgi:signal peptidase
MLVPPLVGLERYVITGGSMEGSIDRGSIVFEEVVPVGELAVGDVITYEPPADSGVDGLVTHRIVSLRARPNGQPVIGTKGDANAKADPWRFRLAAGEQPRVVADVPYLGYGLAALGLREVRMALIGVPALLVAFALLAGMWREAGVEARRITSEATTGD